jgi:hypothetical protein
MYFNSDNPSWQRILKAEHQAIEKRALRDNKIDIDLELITDC